MTFDASAWLEHTISVRTLAGVEELTRHRRLCYLLTCNQCNMTVSGWGFISNSGPGGHQVGFDQEEALEFIHYAGFMSGVEAAGDSVYKELAVHLEAYIAEFKAKELPEVPA